MIKPGTTLVPGHETLLKYTVCTLHHAVGLRVVGRSPEGTDAEEAMKLGPEITCELPPLIRGHVRRDAVPSYPMTDKSVSAVHCGHGRKGNGLHPPRKTVNHGEKVPHAATHRQGTYQVDVEG